MKPERVEIELFPYEFETLKANRMIADMCGKYLESAVERDEFFILDLTIPEAEYMAAEANHAENGVIANFLQWSYSVYAL